MPTISFGQSGNASSGSYTGPWNQGTQYIYSSVTYPTGNLNIDGVRVVNIDSVSLSGSFSATGGYTVSHTSDNRVRVTWNSAYRLNFTRYIDNGLDLFGTPSGFTTRTDGGLRGVTTWSTVPAKPGTPTAVASSSVERRVSLSWTAPDNGGATIRGYNIYDASDNSLLTTTSGTGTTANVTVAAGKLGTNMSFNIAAFNDRGTSQRSNNSNSVLINGNPTAPTISSVTTGTVNSGTLSVSWTAPSNPVTSITGYDIDVSSDNVNWLTFAQVSGTTLSTTLSGLTANALRYVRVRARNAFSDANSSSSSPSGTLSATVSGPPGAPTATAIDNFISSGGTVPARRLKLTWSAPASTGNPSGISEYIVYWYRVSEGIGTAQSASAGTSTNYTVTVDLVPGVDYKMYVVAKGVLTGTGAFSANSNELTAQPSPPSGWDDSAISQDFRVGIPYSDAVARTPGGTIAYSVSSGSLPGGISLNSSTGAIAGTPTTQGKFSFTITATANGIDPINLTFTVYVRPVARRKDESSYTTSSVFKRLTESGWVDVGTVDVSGSPIGMRRYNGTSWVSTTIPTL